MLSESERAALDRDGYLVISLLDADSLSACRRRFDDLGVPEQIERWASCAHAADGLGRECDLWLQREIGPLAKAALGPFRPFLGTFYAKGAKCGTEVPPHQDWTYTDERCFRAVLVWAPLVDVDLANGAMVVVPGSHRWSTGLRPSHLDGPAPLDSFRDELGSRSVAVELAAGEALLFDPALVHATTANGTDEMRPVAGVGMVPEPARVLHFRTTAGAQLEGFVIRAGQDYMDPYFGRLDGLELLDPWAPPVGAAEIGCALALSSPASGPR